MFLDMAGYSASAIWHNRGDFQNIANDLQHLTHIPYEFWAVFDTLAINAPVAYILWHAVHSTQANHLMIPDYFALQKVIHDNQNNENFQRKLNQHLNGFQEDNYPKDSVEYKLKQEQYLISKLPKELIDEAKKNLFNELTQHTISDVDNLLTTLSLSTLAVREATHLYIGLGGIGAVTPHVSHILQGASIAGSTISSIFHVRDTYNDVVNNQDSTPLKAKVLSCARTGVYVLGMSAATLHLVPALPVLLPTIAFTMGSGYVKNNWINEHNAVKQAVKNPHWQRMLGTYKILVNEGNTNALPKALKQWVNLQPKAKRDGLLSYYQIHELEQLNIL